ncbi:MAG: hypothetical protein NT080_11530 [Spirochaetes bacterium]|nr:hypothetical protein [Spirochaetota bacterium]
MKRKTGYIILAAVLAGGLLLGCDFLKGNGYKKEIDELQHQVSTLTQDLKKAVDEPTKAGIKKNLQEVQKKLEELLKKASSQGKQEVNKLLEEMKKAIGQ